MTDESSAPPSNAKWRLEAFDLRAGLAFATCREERTASMEERDWPTFFIGPPDFAPEPLASIAVALSAPRAGFESSLLVDEREAGFETIEDVAEFIRRAYVAAAGGDGSDGPTGVPGPLPPKPEEPGGPSDQERSAKTGVPDRDDGDEFIGEAGSSRTTLRRRAEEFRAAVEGTPRGKSFDFDWNVIEGGDGVDALCRGAVQALRELVRRMPSADPADAQRWRDDARALGTAIAAMGLWQRLLSVSPFEQWMREIMAPARRGLSGPEDFLLQIAPREPGIFSARRARMHPYLFPIVQLPVASWVDPMVLLGRLPLPSFAQVVVGSDVSANASLQHLVSSYVASPQGTLGLATNDSLAVIDLVLFAAALLVCGWALAPLQRDGRPLRSSTQPTDLELHERAAQALRWLSEQLPRRGFEVGLEQHIQDSIRIRYGARRE